ncbi:uncharacterized protein LOC132283079 [Cornus florida]|uniref:uncharacterized protein LOC132283079 n=1 Tax=Cornus florida TaxID=4283 RepID=UPI002897E6C7|nr:uncharacterized protein LOC132283079 [Cornus florida]
MEELLASFTKSIAIVITWCATAMRGTYLRLALVVLLCLALLNCFNAVPITRTKSLMHGIHGHDEVLKNTQMVNAVKRCGVETMKGRMDVELNDYPGSGANNRHTPRSQTGN